MARDVLVVDDEEDVRDFLKSLLEDHGYSVRLAEDGLQAMTLIQEKLPDLVLLDLMMPQETGTGLYRRMREHRELKEVPVIVISGLAGRHVAVSKSVPVFDKPIDQEGLLNAIEAMTAD